MIDRKYNITALENRTRMPLFITAGLAVVLLLAVTGLCQALNSANLSLEDVGDGGYKLETSAAPYRVYFPDSLDSPVRLTSRDHDCEFTLEDMSYNAGEDHLGIPRPVAKKTGDAAVVYPDAFENVDIEYQLTTRGIKEFFVLHERPRTPAGHLSDPTLDFTASVAAGGLVIHVDGAPAFGDFTTDQSIKFIDEISGETVFTMPAPYAVDGAGEAIPIRYSVEIQDEVFIIHTQTPYAWLADPDRAYPVKIDPSTTIDSYTDGYSILLWTGTDTQWDAAWVSGGRYDGFFEDNYYRTGIDFDTTVIPDSATITKVELKLYVDVEDGSVNHDAGKMTQTAETYYNANDQSGFNTDVDGNEYLSNSSGFAGVDAWHTVELLPAAATDLQSQLGGNWFSIGFTGTTESGQNYRDSRSATHATDAPKLIVTYTDTTPPTVTARTTRDNDGDGQIDRIELTFSENIDDSTADAGDFTVTGYTISSIDTGSTADDDQLFLILTESGTADTDATPEVTYTQGTLADLDANLMADQEAWWDTNWRKRAKISLNNTNSAENLTDFPLLVSLNTTNLPSLDLSATVGADVRFRDAATGAEIKYEVEAWDAGTDTATVWVKVPQINSASSTDYIWVYYDYDGTATYDQSAADEQAVWNSNYAGVWHLEESVTDEQTSGTHVDATGINNGTQNNNGPAAGRIAGGQDFDATDDYIVIDNVADDINVSKGSASAWIKMNDMPDRGRVVGAFTDSNNGWLIEWSQTQGGVKFNYEANAVNSIVTDTGTSDTDGLEHFVTLTWDTTAGASGEMKAYTDGVQVGSTITGLGSWAGAINRVYIGASADDGNLEFDGVIDEVRISDIARSADWIEASYLSQNGDFAFTVFGSEESVPADGAGPAIVSAASSEGSTTLTVTFSEPVDTSNSGSGNLVTGDFNYNDVSSGGAGAISSMGADADGTDEVVTLTVDTAFNAGDNNTDTLAAASSQIYDLADNAAGTATVAMTITGVGPPLTGVGNSPGTNTVSDTSTHTVAFTTADALPADGKIVVTFPAGFNLANVGNSDISSSTMDGSFSVSRSGQELTITRSGGSSQSAAAENIIIGDIDNTATVGTSYTVNVETRDSSSTTINGPTTSGTFTIKGKSALTNPDTLVTDSLFGAAGTQPSDVELVGFKITPTGENLTWTNLTISLTYGGGMADADITNAQIYVDNGTVGTYESGTDTQVGAQSVNASGGSLTWNTVGGTISAATNYLIIFDAGASLSASETVRAAVTAANITVTGASSSASITTSGDVTDEPLHTATASTISAYYVEDGDGDCGTETTLTSYVVREFVSSFSCGKGEKWKTNITGSTDLVLGYLNNGGYSNDTIVTGQATGSYIKMKSKNAAATGYIKLVQVNPSTQAVESTLDTHTVVMTAGDNIETTDLSDLTGTVDSGKTFGILVSITPTGTDEMEVKWGKDGNHIIVNVAEAGISTSPITGVSNSPSPNTEGDASTHTIAFTTADALPADGKIVVTFPAGFNLTNVGNSDISSGTMDGSFTVSASGQVLTITRSGGTSQPAAAENIIIADVDNSSTVGTSYTVDVETRDAGDTTINSAAASSTFTITGNSALTNPATQVVDQLGDTGGSQPTDVELVGFKITPTGENLTWTGLVVSLTYGGGMADADITNAQIYVDNGTVGTYESGTDTQVGVQNVNASGGALTWNSVGGTITAATNYLIIFDAGAGLSIDETVQASVTAGNITVTGATTGAAITTSGNVSNEPLHTVTRPLTSVSNSPSPATVSDTSTHTVAFTTSAALPADGKIVVTFPAGFDLTAVGDSDISSGTMDGSFTVSASSQDLTITRSGGSSQSAAAENIIIADISNTGTAGTSYTVDVEIRDSGDSTINGPTTSGTFAITGKSALADPDTQVTDQLAFAGGTQPTDVALVGFKITPTGENLTWTDLVISLTYGGGMADADITSAQIYVDNGTVGTYESGTDTQVGAQSVNASGGSLTWNTVGGTITAATDYLIIFDAGAGLSANETVQAAVTAANITVTGVTTSASITTSGSVTNEPLHTVTDPLTLADHAVGQEPDRLDDVTAVTAEEFFAFQLTNATGATITQNGFAFQLSSVSGLVQGDFDNFYVYVDADGSGDIEGGETTKVCATKATTAIAGATGTITFNSCGYDITDGTTVKMVLTGDLANLVSGDTFTIDLGTADLTPVANGSDCSSATHKVGIEWYQYRKKITIDKDYVGASCSQDLTNFPVMVKITGSDFAEIANDVDADGYDIIFRDADANLLDHEIEEYDETTDNRLVAWVRVPTISWDEDTVIWLHYGNPSVTEATENPSGVWDASFKGVWHLDEDQSGTGNSNLYTDSTSNGNHGDDVISATGQEGVIGPGQEFDGSDDYVSVGNAGSGIKTVSFWLKADDITSREIIDIDGSDQIAINGSSSIVADSFPAATIYVDGSTASSTVTTGWHHVAVTDSTGVNASDLIFGGVMLLYDNFNRTDSNTVGNGWSETDSESGAEARISNNELDFQAEDNTYQPMVSHTFAKQTSGKITWSFILEFERTGDEGTYEAWLQLGDSATMVSPATSVTTGVAVNLRWGDDTNGFTDEEGFGYHDGTSDTQIAVVSGYDGPNTGGFAYVTVTADLDANTFDVSVTGDGLISGTGSATGVAFDNNVDIDTVRIYLNEIGTNIGTMDMDEMLIIGSDYLDGEIDEVRISDTARDACWIETEYSNQNAPATFYSIGAASTAIDLLSFTATGRDAKVQVEWETATETGNLGFYLYRADSADGTYVRITDTLIAGQNFSAATRNYVYEDTDVTHGQSYYYKLEDLDIHGQRTFHGPVGVDWDGAGAPEVAEGDPAPAPWEPGGDAGPVTVSDTDEPVYKIMVAGEGMYRLTRSFLAGQGVAMDKVDLSRVRLYHQAREVAVWVHDDNDDTVFDDADHITFYALPVAAEFAKYSADNVYWLTTGAGANPVKRMTEVDSAADGSDLATGFDTMARSEQDQYYYPNAPGADELDRWLNETWIVGAGISWPGAGDPITFTLDTPGATGNGTLAIQMLGTYNTDHQVDISVNGGPVQTFSWSGIAFYQAVITDAPLVDGLNSISLTCQTAVDALLMDWLAADYPRNFAADSDQLEFSSNSPERFLITDFAGGELLAFDITDPENVSRSINGQTAGSGPYSLEFTPPNGAAESRTYRALSTAALLTPRAVIADAASNLTDAANGADYILITHRSLGWDGSGNQYAWLTDLLVHRQAQGHRVMAVNLTDIYDEFAFGLPTPAAIKDFLAYAVSFWTAPAPQYVLLVGDATYDYKDNWGYGAADDVPAYTIFSEEAGETVTDEWYVLTGGGDVVPDLYIGRLPAATAAEARVMAAKIISYESAVNTKTWQKNIVLAADNQTGYAEAIFESMNEDAADLLPAALQPAFRAYLDGYGTAAALNTDLIARIDAGSLLINYSGHASVQVWAAENIFDSGDVAGLANAGRYPFIVNMSCLSGYFAYPAAWNFPSLSEVLLRAADKGAVGLLVPTGQTDPNYQRILNEALFEAIFQNDIRQVGAAIGRAKQNLLQKNPQQTEVSRTFLLLGDPAMVLQVPLPRRPAGLTAELTPGSTVDLVWDSAQDANGGTAAGYHIYRGPGAEGPWNRLNGTALVDTVYSDSDLTAGAAYYYVVTALDSDGDESAHSETASVLLTDSDNDGLYDLLEDAGCTDVNLSDSDSDGLSDGAEDANRNGTVDAGETDPCNSDSDADNLPDGWEITNGLNALSGSGADGADGDPDGDGWTSHQEYVSCTDPADAAAVPSAPTVPALNYPANGSEVTTLEPWLSVSNAADPDCQNLRYIFELYADAGLTTLVDGTVTGGIAEGDNTTAWQPGSALNENTRYYWRARAHDGLVYSDWTITAAFFVNTTPEAPTTPAVSAPPDGSEVTSRRPTLEVSNAADADGDLLTYAFEVYADASLTILVDSQTAVAEGSGTTTWQVAVELDDNTDYWWTVQAGDNDGLTSGWSAAARFFVNTANDAPGTPPGGSPADGAEVTATTQLLSVNHVTDADLDPISYYFEIDTVPTFDGFELEQSGELSQESGASTGWTPLELMDNTTYYWRARAFDGAAYGAWYTTSFFVNTANDAPGTPTVDHPGDGSQVTTRQPTLMVKAAPDADLDVLVYEYELYEDAELTALVTDVTGGGQAWQVDQTLDDNRTYFWRARALDPHGAAGPWSNTVSFFINTANDNPDTPVLNNPVSGGIATSLNPTLSVFNVDDADGDALTYTFELYADADLSQPVSSAIVAEGYLITSWSVSATLDDHGIYYWRARADDGQQPGSWMPTAVLQIHTAGIDTAYEVVTRQPVSAAAIARQTVNVSTVDSPIYNTVVELPPGALPRDCALHIGPVTNPPALPRGTRKIGPVIEFGPSGMIFNVPVTLKLPYTATALNQARVASPVELSVYWYDPSILAWVPVEIESIDTVNQLISIETEHFSMYTIGAEVADASGGGGGGSCFIAAAQRAETFFFIAKWPNTSICGLLALIGLLWLGKRKRRR